MNGTHPARKIPASVLFLSNGDVRNPFAASGVASALFNFLTSTFEQAIPVDVSLGGLDRLLNTLGAASFHRERWKARLDLNLWAFRRRSTLARARVGALGRSPSALFQLGCLWSPPDIPGVPLFLRLDFTNAIAQKEFPDWAPFRSASQARRWLELERQAYRRAALTFVVSNRARTSLIEDYGVSPDRVQVIGSGGHLTPPNRLDKSYDGRTILFIGRDFVRKGGPVLLDAFRTVRQRIPNARLVIVGPAPGGSLRQPGVEALGWVGDRQRLSHLLQEAHVFALPSLCDPFPQVLLEAMAFRLPCVAADTGGVPEIIDDGINGYVVPRGDTALLAERILALLSSIPLSSSFGEAARQKVASSLNLPAVFDRMRRGMETVIQRAPHPSSLQPERP